ncbi:MAG: DUF937 domain-containing protein [Polaromonas sp.]|nr:DUF937 domain-containing protein [Polaromonas sp.]
MGLLDSVLGSVMGGQQAQAGSGGGMGGLGNIGGLLNMVTSNPQLLQALTGMLSNDGEHGGLGGLVAKFQQAGLGEVVGSWIGSGQNQPVSGDQLTNVLGSDAITGLAQKLGISPDAAAGQLSNILPGLIDHLTPHGQAPAGGLGNSGDLMGMLGGLLKR